jgi:hypothetical protein
MDSVFEAEALMGKEVNTTAQRSKSQHFIFLRAARAGIYSPVNIQLPTFNTQRPTPLKLIAAMNVGVGCSVLEDCSWVLDVERWMLDVQCWVLDVRGRISARAAGI